ncbi:MAG: rRNA maturation RNase YbeY [Candidatus Omnitrophica bacterium]|nr:rRNA maturation RNase YbeY [Candidatus Omnitrophota bacterium]
MVDLNVDNISRCYFLNKKKLEREVAFILKKLGLRDARLSIYFATDEEIRRLNRLYRKSDRSTDVLAFSMAEGRCLKGDPRYLGDIAISVDRAKAQAKSFDSTFKKEIYLYIIHGILHLLGHDDENKKSKKKMSKTEGRLLDLLWRKIDS